MNMSSTDQLVMRLVHYFITKENYQPILVNGVENEIWLENLDSNYEVVRINSNYIHNNEQLDFDIFKTNSVIKQIKKKTLSFKCKSLNIFLNVGENVKFEDHRKNMDLCKIDVDEGIENNKIMEIFPELKDDEVDAGTNMDFFINVTNDINSKTEEKNRLFEKTFKKKPIVITYALIFINILIFMLSVAGILNVSAFSMNKAGIQNHEYYRLITAAFFHVDIIHLLCNMYSLAIIGKEVETVLGKKKFIVVYLMSALISSLLSGVLGNYSSIGASGAIFGLLGALLYFGYHYRLYLGNVMMTGVVPVIILNLVIGFMNPMIDNFGHIGGLIGGIFSAMIVGIEGRTDKSDTINGIIITTILIGFLMYMLLFR